MMSAVRGAVVVALAFAGCGGIEPCPEVYFDEEIAVPETSTSTIAGGRVSAHADPGQGVTLAIDDNQGTIGFDGRGPLQAFVYQQQPFDGQILFSGLAIEDGTWFPFWLYCDPGGRLTYLYGERSDRSYAVFPAISGTCSVADGPFAFDLHVPAHHVRHVSLTCGFAVHDDRPGVPPAPALDLGDSRPGTMLWNNNQATVLVFATVDCRSCGTPNWYEFHALVWDPAATRLAFGIFFTFPDDSQPGVQAELLMELPAASTSIFQFPAASWSLSR
jgi:hypothetical protein